VIEVGGVALLPNVKNDRAAAWCQSYRAVTLLDTPRTLVLPLAAIEAALKNAAKL